MEKQNILDLIKKGESETTEFKKSTTQLDKSLKAICGFLNHKGGIIYFGIDKNGKIIGQEVSDQTLKSISQKIRQKIKPEISPEIKVLETGNRRLIEVKVKEGNNKPYYLEGIAYKSVGSENVVIPPEELERIILEKRKIYFDSEICEEASLEDIDLKKVEKYIKLASEIGRKMIKEEPLVILKKIELIKGNKPTWAAILLFGKEPQRFVLQAKIHCGKFKISKIEILDDRMILGDLIEQAEEAMNFIKKYLSVRFVITGKPKREEIWEYPLGAIREGIINAIIHRDYTEPSEIQVEVYDDKIEIWNPGKLPLGISIEDLYREDHKSIPRNKFIAQIFYDIGFIEKYGSGTVRMLEFCKKAGIFIEFKEISNGFSVIFRKDIFTEEYLRSLGINERQIKAVNVVKEEEKINNKKYQELFSISKKTASRELAELTKKNIFERKGITGKGTFYYIRTQRGHKGVIKGS